jgi:hypothetical protein
LYFDDWPTEEELVSVLDKDIPLSIPEITIKLVIKRLGHDKLTVESVKLYETFDFKIRDLVRCAIRNNTAKFTSFMEVLKTHVAGILKN